MIDYAWVHIKSLRNLLPRHASTSVKEKLKNRYCALLQFISFMFCAIVDMDGKRVFEKKLPCELERVLQGLKPFKKHQSPPLGDFTGIVPFATFRRISQNFSPAGVRSPFFARAMPTERTSFVPVNGR